MTEEELKELEIEQPRAKAYFFILLRAIIAGMFFFGILSSSMQYFTEIEDLDIYNISMAIACTVFFFIFVGYGVKYEHEN